MDVDDDLRRMSQQSAEAIMVQRADFRSAVENAATKFRVQDLTGLPVGDARTIVEAAGGEFVPIGENDLLTLKLDVNRVVAEVEAGLVVRASVG